MLLPVATVPRRPALHVEHPAEFRIRRGHLDPRRVDSVAHVLPGAYVLDKERTKVPAYWKMEKRINSSMAGTEPRLFEHLPRCR